MHATNDHDERHGDAPILLDHDERMLEPMTVMWPSSAPGFAPETNVDPQSGLNGTKSAY